MVVMYKIQKLQEQLDNAENEDDYVRFSPRQSYMKKHREDDELQNDFTQLADTEANQDFMIFSPRNNNPFDPSDTPI